VDLKKIQDPHFLKDLSVKECEALSEEIRRFLIDTLADTGGHFSSNLGVVELTIALHRQFDSPKDRIVFDVGHQGYVHKILTGRAESFTSLRQHDGLSGFLKRDESPHDVFEAGHSSTSIAASAGMLFAKPHTDIGHIVTFIGDGALASGMALEALNFIGHYPEKTPIIVLNDNEMSISENVGHLARMLTKVRMRRSYRSLKRRTRRFLPKFLRGFTTRVEQRIKGFISGYTTFESMGYEYFGPLDGHDFKQLFQAFETAKKTLRPTVIHVRTTKGKGYEPAENDKTGRWHGVPPFDKETGDFKKKTAEDRASYSDIVARYMEERIKGDTPFYVVTPAMISGSKLQGLKDRFPEHVIDTGIAESTSVTLSGTLASEGVGTFLTVYSTFLQRGYDQIIHDVARMRSPLVIGLDRAGVVGGDGETHQGIYDIPMLSHIPHVTIAHPRDGRELIRLFNRAFHSGRDPFVIRYPKMDVPFDEALLADDSPLIEGWELIRDGASATIITFGPMLDELDDLIEREDLDVRLINSRFIKPLDKETLDAVPLDKPLLIHEESTLKGGLGSMILQYLATHRRVPPFRQFGFDDAFVSQGARDEVLKDYGIDAQSVIDALKEMLDEA